MTNALRIEKAGAGYPSIWFNVGKGTLSKPRYGSWLYTRILGFFGTVLLAADALALSTFEVDATRAGRVLPNVQQTLVTWQLTPDSFRNVRRQSPFDPLEFVEYIEVMGATGGNSSRDCYRNPQDRTTLDDYDFSNLVAGCRNIVALGCKPYLKLGNVPQKLSSGISEGDFHMNIRPPDDYAAYGRYMKACAEALLRAFGRDELLTWRFAVLTEFENPGWFADVTRNPEKTFQAYCRLYETTVTGFVRTISPDLTIGVHAMAVTEGLWDERKFLKFAAERKLPIKFVTASFYDKGPGRITDGLPLPKTIAHLRTAAESVGLTNLQYGVDEGRLLWGVTRARPHDDLCLRVVGDTYQAAYDARVVRQILEAHADYFAAWGYFSGSDRAFEGLPSVSFYVARESAKFKGMLELPVVEKNAVTGGVENGVVAARSADGTCVRLMAYAFTNALFAVGRSTMEVRIRVPEAMQNRMLSLTGCVVDDDANWFDEWRADRKRLGIGDDRFGWSPDDPSVMAVRCGLKDPKDRALFKNKLEPKYRACSRLWEEQTVEKATADGWLVLRREIPYGGVWFVDVRPSPKN